ncbi:unnamed protein product [Leptidea sinapis]|uniref:Uncharacterized protein n=1 Tax=Leptidea sinapis TaxID=189913 RepID=A0A5E4PMT3_9NEOP|nr:unnamed protein product [Leptidea sinapis]
MENKQPSCKKSLVPDEKLKRKVYHDAIAGQSNCYNKPLFLEIVHKGPHKNDSQKVLVSIKPRTPAIKTLYVAEKYGVSPGRTPKSTMATKDIGFNVNINISDTSYGEDAKE